MKELIFLVFLLPRLEEREEVESSVFDDLSLTWLGRLLDFRPDDVEELSVRRLAAGLDDRTILSVARLHGTSFEAKAFNLKASIS